jgi:phospho-N-acetylmuramoyl-pentapeptide-transferase
MDAVFAFGLSFLISLAAGRPIIFWLRRLKAGQSIKSDGPAWHMGKQGTPTMGGIMFILGIFVAVLVAGWRQIVSGEYGHLFIFLFAMVYGGIGIADDLVKVRKKQNGGFTAPQKFLLQLAVAVAFLALLRYTGYLSPDLYLPFTHVSIVLSWPLSMAFDAFLIVGFVNAVNLTDGAEGLASCVTLPVALFYCVAAVVVGYTALGIYASAVVGGLCAFLFYNFYPARVFMGDTGSLFLGGCVVGMAFALDLPLILLPAGLVYLAEALSDILQVIYFKATRGKRIFRMAPLHHHFEMGGWSERKLCLVFGLVSAIGCMAACFGMLGRYTV